MIALDTNVLVRFLLRDDDEQSRAVDRLLAHARRDGTPLFVPDVVLCELVWVIASRERRSRSEISAAIEQILDAERIVVSDPGVARRALAAYRDGSGDFADYLIREQALDAGASVVVTFDKTLKGEEGFRVLGPSSSSS